jgi:hypothetical protein
MRPPYREQDGFHPQAGNQGALPLPRATRVVARERFTLWAN